MPNPFASKPVFYGIWIRFGRAGRVVAMRPTLIGTLVLVATVFAGQADKRTTVKDCRATTRYH
jgi:hypothetical protein